MKDGAIWVWDAKGDSAKITIKNVMQSNGVIHVIDTVLLPSKSSPLAQRQPGPPCFARGGLLSQLRPDQVAQGRDCFAA